MQIFICETSFQVIRFMYPGNDGDKNATNVSQKTKKKSTNINIMIISQETNLKS